MQNFGLIDYGIFIAMLGVSSAIGLYFGIKDKRNNQGIKRRRESIEMNYLVGGRKMQIFPVAVSLAASMVSGIQLLGLSTEIYVYGTQFVFILITFVLSSIGVHYLFIPVYMDLKLTSSYQYLEARFDRKIRYLGATMFLVTNIFIMPIALYATALAFNQGVGIHIITTSTCLVCIFYTTLGGMKAVVWTDVLQTVIMYATMIVIVIKGTIQVGGFKTIWDRNVVGGRIELPSFTFNPTVRHSFLAIVIGGTFQIFQTVSISQLYIQRFVSLPSKLAAQKALWLFTIVLLILFSMCFYNGLLIYATYYDCDPVTTKLAQTKDQLLPLLVMNLLSDLPGVAGLFVAGIFSATLSTLSTTLNSFSAVILEDFIKPSTSKPISKCTTQIIMQGIVLLSGLVCVCIVFILEKFGGLFQLHLSIISCTSGPLLGIFLIGLLLPWVKSNSAFFGGTVSFFVMLWITVKAQMAILSKEIVFEPKSIATYGCTYNYTTVMTQPIIQSDPVSPQIYHVSYLWYGMIGTMITIIAACLATFVFGRQNPHIVDPVLLAPCVRKYYRTEDHVGVNTNQCQAMGTSSIAESTYKFPSLQT